MCIRAFNSSNQLQNNSRQVFSTSVIRNPYTDTDPPSKWQGYCRWNKQADDNKRNGVQVDRESRLSHGSFARYMYP